MWFDALALGLLLLFAVIGAWRGGLASGLALFALIAGYASALLIGPGLADPVAAAFGAPRWLGLPLGGSVAFLGAFLVVGILGFFLRRAERERRGEEERGALDRLLGASFGGLRGLLVVFLLAYLVNWLDALRATGNLEGMPAIGTSLAVEGTRSAVEAGVQAALGDNAAGPGRAVATFAARPAEAVTALRDVIDHPTIDRLREDRVFWTYVEADAPDAAMRQESYAYLVHDAELRGKLAALGLVPPAAADSPEVFHAEMRAIFAELTPRLNAVREDPDFQALMQDPELLTKLQAGDTLALLGDPRFQSVVSRALEAPVGASAAP